MVKLERVVNESKERNKKEASWEWGRLGWGAGTARAKAQRLKTAEAAFLWSRSGSVVRTKVHCDLEQSSYGTSLSFTPPTPNQTSW